MKLHLLLMVTSICLLLPVLPLIIGDLNSDRQALLDFASAVPHSRKHNWNSSVPICSWSGITCNRTRVIGLHLPDVGLYGPIPPNTIGTLDALRALSLRSNHLNGSIPSDIVSMPSLRSVCLEDNAFSGRIPTFHSASLIVLDLSFNFFSGSIPPTINNLQRLTTLRLQFNSLSGSIPDLNLPRLELLNLSHNILNGSIPSSLTMFPYSSFEGNYRLCGAPLIDCLTRSPPASIPTSPPTFYRKHRSRWDAKVGAAALIASITGGFSIVCVLVLVICCCCCRKKNVTSSRSLLKVKAANAGRNEKSEDFGSGVQAAEKNKLIFFERCSYSFDLEDLLRASAEVLGKGSFGTTYKAVLDENVIVVVKRLREVGVAKKEFDQQMEIIGRIGQHPNVVPLRSYYYSKDEKLIVCEFIPTGSLSALLHGNRGTGRASLDWDTRLKISLGTAKGIAHIHSEGGARFSHGNIKSSNVLLTQDHDGCISDFGLAPLMNFPATPPRSPGYRAPEAIEPRKITQKSDVYSFGVLLLELLTGKAPVRISGHEDVVDLPRWVRSVVREEWTAEVFDAELLRYQNVEEEMVQMLQIALSCVAKVPENRPAMSEVVRMIEEVRQPELSNRPSPEEMSKGSNMETP